MRYVSRQVADVRHQQKEAQEALEEALEAIRALEAKVCVRER